MYNPMDTLLARFYKEPLPEPKATITGTPAVIAKYILSDIAAVKTEIKRQNEATGLLASNTTYLRLYSLLLDDQKRELDALKKAHDYQTGPTNVAYQKLVVAAYKRHLRELDDVLAMLQNNYNHGVYEKHIVQYRQRLGSGAAEASSGLSSMISPVTSEESNAGAETDGDEDPDWLVDPISFELFSEPVVAPSGITYEKSHLVAHLLQKGKFDPLTRQPLRESQLCPNLAVRDAVLAYVKGVRQK